jgi:hypothetical protein
VLLPNAGLEEIDPQKLHGYPARQTHPIVRFKARFFAALGYSAERWQALEADLRIQHLTQDAQPSESFPEGPAFTIQAILKGSNGQSAVVLSVWFVAGAGGPPRFVTAYPGGAK